MFRPQNGPYKPDWGQKSKFQNLRWEKLHHPFQVKCHGESIGDNLNALKRCLDPEMALRGLFGAKIENLKSELVEKLDH